MHDDNNTLTNLIKAKDPLIYVQTYEENALVAKVVEIARQAKVYNKFSPEIYTYSQVSGLQKINPASNDFDYNPKDIIPEVKNTLEALKYVQDMQYNLGTNKNALLAKLQKSNNKIGENAHNCMPSIFIFKDLHLNFNDRNVIRILRDLKEAYNAPNYCPIIITSPVLQLPIELEKLVTFYEFPLLTTKEIEAKLNCITSLLKLSDKEKHDLAVACSGLTERELKRAMSHSLAKHNSFKSLTADIHAEKLEIVKKNPALDIITPAHKLEDLGGCENFKAWIKQLKMITNPMAKAYGIPAPKAAMLVGLPGTSKTVSSEILADYLQMPLISLNMSQVMGSLVGQSEQQLANALKIAQSISPCVLLIDEMDKAIGGIQSSNSCDAGTLSRVVGQMLNFLQRDDTNVFTIMTSNDITQLPPELTRSGRVDAIWFFDLPTKTERREIINIYLRKAELNCTQETIDYMVTATDNFTGAELQAMVKGVLINTYTRQIALASANVNRNPILEDIEKAIGSTVTVYKANQARLAEFRTYAADRYLLASKPEISPVFSNHSPCQLPLAKIK